MKDYRDRFIWKPFIDKLKKDESMSVHYINGMILDLNEGDNIIGNNIDNIEMKMACEHINKFKPCQIIYTEGIADFITKVKLT